MDLGNGRDRGKMGSDLDCRQHRKERSTSKTKVFSLRNWKYWMDGWLPIIELRKYCHSGGGGVCDVYMNYEHMFSYMVIGNQGLYSD